MRWFLSFSLVEFTTVDWPQLGGKQLATGLIGSEIGFDEELVEVGEYVEIDVSEELGDA